MADASRYILNPKGYWRHASGVAQIELDNNAKRLGKATQLHRVNKGLTKSGIISSAGVANKQLPEVLARMVLENSAIPSNTQSLCNCLQIIKRGIQIL